MPARGPRGRRGGRPNARLEPRDPLFQRLQLELAGRAADPHQRELQRQPRVGALAHLVVGVAQQVDEPVHRRRLEPVGLGLSRARSSSVAATSSGGSPSCWQRKSARRWPSRSVTSDAEVGAAVDLGGDHAAGSRRRPSATMSSVWNSTSPSVVPSSSRTSATPIRPSQAVDSWSSVETASRKLPPAARATRPIAAGSMSIDSASAMRCSTAPISGSPGRWKTNRWQRLRMVGSIACISVVQSTNTTCSGGSSSVFRTALDASFVSMWASSTM